MSESIVANSALIEIAENKPLVDSIQVKIVENKLATQFILKGLLSDESFVNCIKTILSVELPDKANTVLTHENITIAWMAPDQWLILAKGEREITKVSMLAGALETIFASLNEITSGQTILSLSGDKALEIINKGTTLDVHPSVFKPGQCAQTMFAKANVMIIVQADERKPEKISGYDLVIRRSFADFLARWLIDACYEYEEVQ